MGVTPARMAALEVLRLVRERGAFAHEIMSTTLGRTGLVGRESAFATALAYGVISCRGTLDAVVSSYLSNPDSTDPAVIDALALATYEIVVLGSSAHSAVDQGVEAVKRMNPRLAGLANAVLRKVARESDTVLDRATASGRTLRELQCHPEWMYERFVRDYGEREAALIAQANNGSAPLYISVLPFKSTPEDLLAQLESDGVSLEPLPSAGGYRAANPSAAVRSRPVSRGEVIVADGGAQLVAALVPLVAGGTTLDIGSGRGTKTLLLAARAAREAVEATIIGVDLHEYKTAIARDRAEDLGVRNVEFVAADALRWEELPGHLRGVYSVLVDAPCSGLGTLRRHPDRRWRATPGEIEQLAALNLQLLESAAHLVAPGGYLVYSTCTIAREENQDTVSRFLDAHPEYSVDPLTPIDIPEEYGRFITAEGYFASVPTPGGIDGHFAVRMVRSA